MIQYLKRNQKLRKYEEKLLGSDCPRITNCTSIPILDRICYVYIPKHQSYCSRNCLKQFVGVTQEKDLCLTEPSPKDIGGQVCRRKPKSMSRSVINAKGLLQTSTNRVESSILSLVLWPFARWGLDIVGAFPKVVGNKRYLLVDTDYFTKWVKAKPLANIRDVDAKKFI